MNTQEKSLKLAELVPEFSCGFRKSQWNPYARGMAGLAQAHYILLKFPEVMTQTVEVERFGEMENECMWDLVQHKPTQANILDEILRMNGIEV